MNTNKIYVGAKTGKKYKLTPVETTAQAKTTKKKKTETAQLDSKTKATIRKEVVKNFKDIFLDLIDGDHGSDMVHEEVKQPILDGYEDDEGMEEEVDDYISDILDEITNKMEKVIR